MNGEMVAQLEGVAPKGDIGTPQQLRRWLRQQLRHWANILGGTPIRVHL